MTIPSHGGKEKGTIGEMGPHGSASTRATPETEQGSGRSQRSEAPLQVFVVDDQGRTSCITCSGLEDSVESLPQCIRLIDKTRQVESLRNTVGMALGVETRFDLIFGGKVLRDGVLQLRDFDLHPNCTLHALRFGNGGTRYGLTQATQ